MEEARTSGKGKGAFPSAAALGCDRRCVDGFPWRFFLLSFHERHFGENQGPWATL